MEKLEDISKGRILHIKEFGKMLVQYVDSRKIVLMGRQNKNSIKSIVGIEVIRDNLVINNRQIQINEPYELTEIPNIGEHKRHYQMMDASLEYGGLR
jgi:hypothetical protein